MARSIEELKQIFLEEQMYMIDNYTDVLVKAADKVALKESYKDEAKTIKEVAKERLLKRNITEEELNIIKQHDAEWQKDVIPHIMQKIFNDPSKIN